MRYFEDLLTDKLNGFCLFEYTPTKSLWVSPPIGLASPYNLGS
jgi:hypothetical protein